MSTTELGLFDSILDKQLGTHDVQTCAKLIRLRYPGIEISQFSNGIYHATLRGDSQGFHGIGLDEDDAVVQAYIDSLWTPLQRQYNDWLLARHRELQELYASHAYQQGDAEQQAALEYHVRAAYQDQHQTISQAMEALSK